MIRGRSPGSTRWRDPLLASLLAVSAPASPFADGPPWEAMQVAGCTECHFGAPAVHGSGALAIAGLPASVTAEARHRLTVRLIHGGMASAGFLLEARSAAAPAGEFIPVDERTATRAHLARSTRAGTALTGPEESEWALEWRAPAEIRGPVRFTLWANASDDDRSPLGDVVHHREWEVAAAGEDGSASAPEDRALLRALRSGGANIYFRHAATDWSRADRLREHGDWRSCDSSRMRQLSEPGRAVARAVGASLRALEIPVGRVLASPYCRTMETARLLAVGPVEATTDVMNLLAAEHFGGRAAVVDRARRRLASPPTAGTNTIMVAHGNLVRAATGEYPEEAGAIVFRPGAGGALEVIARLAPADWARLVRAAQPQE